MKSNANLSHEAVVFFLMTLVLMLLSWIGSIYGWYPVQSLLSVEGIRWALNHVVSDYVHTPALGVVLMLFMGVGVGIRSGYYNAWKRMCQKGVYVSRKERRSLFLSTLAGIIYALLVLFSIPFLRSVTGSLLHSPFQNGSIFILSFGLGVMGAVYGYASRHLRHSGQLVEGMSCLISRYAGYFVTLFFIVQFFSVLSYTRLSVCLGVSDSFMNAVLVVVSYLPLISVFVRGGRK